MTSSFQKLHVWSMRSQKICSTFRFSYKLFKIFLPSWHLAMWYCWWSKLPMKWVNFNPTDDPTHVTSVTINHHDLEAASPFCCHGWFFGFLDFADMQISTFSHFRHSGPIFSNNKRTCSWRGIFFSKLIRFAKRALAKSKMVNLVS